MISVEIKKNDTAVVSVNGIKGTVKIIPIIPGDNFVITPSHYLEAMGMFYFVSANPLGGYDITESAKPDCRGPILFYWTID